MISRIINITEVKHGKRVHSHFQLRLVSSSVSATFTAVLFDTQYPQNQSIILRQTMIRLLNCF